MSTTLRKDSQKAERSSAAEVARPQEYLYPPVNITETREHFLLEAEMPGVAKSGLEITLEGNALTIIGHRSPDEVKAQLVYRESKPMDYRRVFEIDPSINGSKISARMDQGVLHLTLPKAEQVKPRKISVG